MQLNLSNQRTLAQGWLDEFQAFQTAMEARREVWNKLSPEQRKRWVKAAYGTPGNRKTFAQSKDPVMWLAIKIKLFFDTFELEDSED
jgi:hypothetical protein